MWTEVSSGRSLTLRNLPDLRTKRPEVLSLRRECFPFPPGSCTRRTAAAAVLEGFAGCPDYSSSHVPADAADMESLNPHMELLGRLITATEMRQRVISNNIANVNTPNYQRIDVEFESQLAEELNGRSTGHAAPVISLTPGLTARADGNNVDIDREIGQLNKNAMLQQTYIQLLGSQLEQMRLAIEGS
jgi:flagellar basal-body rod protein FlgB